MAAASRADPELIGRPRHSCRGIAQFHLGAATLAPDVEVDVGHAADSNRLPGFTRQTSGFAFEPYYYSHVIPAVILGAGKSSRMGRPKSLLPLGPHETFLTRIIRTF